MFCAVLQILAAISFSSDALQPFRLAKRNLLTIQVIFSNIPKTMHALFEHKIQKENISIMLILIMPFSNPVVHPNTLLVILTVAGQQL